MAAAAAVRDLEQMAIEGDIEEGDPDYRYINGYSTDCIFYYSDDIHPLFFYFLHPEANVVDAINLYHHADDLCSSTAGLILSRPYAVWNPFYNGVNSRIIPPRDHPDEIPRVLIVRKVKGHNYYVFHIVCALPSVRYPGAHRFDVFSSDTNRWHLSEAEHFLGRIIANTGVACGSRAYWLTEMPSVVYYDSAGGITDIIGIPFRFRDFVMSYRMQLGTRDESLCFVVATEVKLEVYIMEPSRQWSLCHRINFRRREVPIPMRFQSRKLQVLFWDDDLFVLEESWRNPARFHIRSLSFEELVLPDFPDDVLPHVNNFHIHPSIDFPILEDMLEFLSNFL